MPKKVGIGGLHRFVEEYPNTRPVKTYGDLEYTLRKLGVKPGEAFRIINEKKHHKEEGSIRFNWKMIRFTLYVWERLQEEKNGYLKPKIDTVKKVVENRKFRNFYLAYFPDIDFNYTDEVRKLNKLIAEKPQQQYFKEGYYLYPGSRKVIPQSHLNNILYPKK